MLSIKNTGKCRYLITTGLNGSDIKDETNDLYFYLVLECFKPSVILLSFKSTGNFKLLITCIVNETQKEEIKYKNKPIGFL